MSLLLVAGRFFEITFGVSYDGPVYATASMSRPYPAAQ
jgi:hypothetical protein